MDDTMKCGLIAAAICAASIIGIGIIVNMKKKKKVEKKCEPFCQNDEEV